MCYFTNILSILWNGEKETFIELWIIINIFFPHPWASFQPLHLWKLLFHRIKSTFPSMAFKVFSKQSFISLIIVIYHTLSGVNWLIDWLLIPYCLQSTFLGNRFWEGDLHVESLSKGEESWIGQKMEEMQLQQRVLELGWPFRVAPPWGKGVRSHLTFPSSVQH